MNQEGSTPETSSNAVNQNNENIEDKSAPEVWINLSFTHQGQTHAIRIPESDRVYDLKSIIFIKTHVPPERQKILGLVKGKLPPEEDTIESLRLQNGKKFSLIGTPVGDEIKDPAQMELLPDIFNDLDIDFSRDPKASEAYIADRRNQRKIREATEILRKNLTLMSPLREGKKLLVLDIDYTILDTKPLIEGALPPTECARPKLHEFLKAIYPFYDICIWSQTSWIWLETKLHELGMIGPEQTNYKINFGKQSKLSFSSAVLMGVMDQFSTKPIIWNLFPQYNASNTIHVDDLGRNFALNPGEGLKIRAFKEAHTERALADRELVWLARYMIHVAAVPDLKKVDHKEWKKVVRAFDPPEEGQ